MFKTTARRIAIGGAALALSVGTATPAFADDPSAPYDETAACVARLVNITERWQQQAAEIESWKTRTTVLTDKLMAETAARAEASAEADRLAEKVARLQARVERLRASKH